MTSTDLESIVSIIFQENANRSAKGLQSDLGVQNRFMKSYKTRYFLELIQNARDAIVKAGQKEGKIKAWFEGEVFYFANNGIQFDKGGVESICYPAISTKDEKEMVGHKGIGFNAILEITDCPEIITTVGTFRFSTEDTANILKINSDQLPLFQFPIFGEQSVISLFPELASQGYTTVIKIPLTKKTNAAEALKKALEISGQDIVFLSAINHLDIGDQVKKISPQAPYIRLLDQGKPSLFRQFEHKFHLSADQISLYDEDEREQFQKSTAVECKFLLRCDEDGRFLTDRNSKLYLFYAMDVITGFSFSIHSFFSVSIDRKNLTKESRLNSDLFKAISDYLTGAFLDDIKHNFKEQVLSILTYTKQQNGYLEPLYAAVKTALSNKAFIYHPAANEFLTPSQILLVTEEENRLFSDSKLGNKYLLHINDNLIYNWLKNECGVKTLDRFFVQEHIESKCDECKTMPDFFSRLYNQNFHWQYPLSTKKILLTQHGNLVAGNVADVYYQRKAELHTPEALEARLAFLHPSIKVDDIRESSAKLLGLKEYSEDQLIAAAIALFLENSPVDAPIVALDIIRFFKRLNTFNLDNIFRISRTLQLPVIHKKTGVKTWKNLFHHPIYFENFEFTEAYLDEYYFADISLLQETPTETGWTDYLQKIGVWNKPGMYIAEERRTSPIDQSKSIDNDRLFHLPTGAVGQSFTNVLINEWADYHKFITAHSGTSLSLRIQSASNTVEADKIQYSSAIFQLKNTEWLYVPDYPQLLKTQNVIAISETDYHKVANQILLEYLQLIKLDFVTDKEFIIDLGIIHLSNNSVDNYENLLSFVEKKFPDFGQPKERTAFEKFYNRILTYLHDFLNTVNGREYEVKQFEQSYFLCRSLIDQSLSWAQGKDIINVDQKTFLDQLIASDLLIKIRHPYSFTKKDRNEWGKYGQRIGRPLSKLVKTKIVSEGNFCELITVLSNPEVVVAFVEDDQANNFNQETLELLRGKMICEHSPLRVEMDIEGQQFALTHQYFTTGEKDKTILHIDSSLTDFRDKKLSAALSDFFEHFADMEMKRLDLIIEDIQRLISQKGKYKYATDRDIDINRLSEIALVFDKGITTAPIPIAVKSDTQTIQTTGLGVAVEVQTVIETHEVKDVALIGGLDENLATIDNLLFHPVVGFDGTTPASMSATNQNATNGHGTGGGGAGVRTLLSERSRKNIGFLGEYYIYKMLIGRYASLLQLLGLDSADPFETEWFNINRLQDPSAKDGSIGRGCDIQISNEKAIEVKAMIGTSDIITLTKNELTKMRLMGDEYYLVILKNLLDTDKFFTTVVKNPYQHILDGTLSFVEAQLSAPATKSSEIFNMNVIPETEVNHLLNEVKSNLN